MAVSVIGAAADDRGSTFNVDAQRLVIDMEDNIELLEDDVAPLVKMLQSPELGRRTANATKIEWPSSERLPVLTTLSASYAANASPPSTTAISVATGTGQYFRIHDLIKNELTGEIMRVNSIATDALTVLRNIGNTGVAGAASIGSADNIVRLGNASAQGATMPTVKMTKTVFEWNWTQIQRDGVGVVNSTRNVKMYGGPYLDVERNKKRIEHYVALEQTLWFGKRDLQTAVGSFGDTSRAQTICGGILGQFLTANITSSIGTLSAAALMGYLDTAMRYGSNTKVGFCSPRIASVLLYGSGFNGGKININWTEASAFGVKVNKIQTASGGTLNLVVKPDWQDYPNTNPSVGGSLVILDMSALKYATLPGRNTKLLDNAGQGRQAPDADLYLEEWLSEFSLEMKFGGSQGGSGGGKHAWLRGITG
jgi:hypothetical protein